VKQADRVCGQLQAGVKCRKELQLRISKLRRKLKNKKYVERLYEKFCNDSSRWHNFEEFECNSFFVGSDKARLNRIKYNKKMRIIERHINFLEKLMDI